MDAQQYIPLTWTMFGIPIDGDWDAVMRCMPQDVILRLENTPMRVTIKGKIYQEMRVERAETIQLLRAAQHIASKLNITVYFTDYTDHAGIRKMGVRFIDTNAKASFVVYGFLDTTCNLFIPKYNIKSNIPPYAVMIALNLPLPTTYSLLNDAIRSASIEGEHRSTPSSEFQNRHLTDIIRASITYPLKMMWQQASIPAELIQHSSHHIDVQDRVSILPILSDQDVAHITGLDHISRNDMASQIVTIKDLREATGYPQNYIMLEAGSDGIANLLHDYPHLTNDAIDAMISFFESIQKLGVASTPSTDSDRIMQHIHGFFNLLQQTDRTGKVYLRATPSRVTLDYLMPPIH